MAVMKIVICNKFLVLLHINQQLQKSSFQLSLQKTYLCHGRESVCLSFLISPDCRHKDAFLEASKNSLRWTPIKSHSGLISSSGMELLLLPQFDFFVAQCVCSFGNSPSGIIHSLFLCMSYLNQFLNNYGVFYLFFFSQPMFLSILFL